MSHEEAIGLGGPAFRFPIERGSVREFARTLFAFRPEYLEEGHPPMFPSQTVVAGCSWGCMLEDPKDTDLAKVDIDPMMSLDAEQEFIFLDGPSRAGEDLQSRARVDDIREKRGRRRGALTFFRTRSEYTRRDVTPVSPGWATFAVSG